MHGTPAYPSAARNDLGSWTGGNSTVTIDHISFQ
jgi:hypothetical protein